MRQCGAFPSCVLFSPSCCEQYSISLPGNISLPISVMPFVSLLVTQLIVRRARYAGSTVQIAYTRHVHRRLWCLQLRGASRWDHGRPADWVGFLRLGDTVLVHLLTGTGARMLRCSTRCAYREQLGQGYVLLFIAVSLKTTTNVPVPFITIPPGGGGYVPLRAIMCCQLQCGVCSPTLCLSLQQKQRATHYYRRCAAGTPNACA